MQTVFIGGYLRTGTTLIQTLLCSSPETNSMVREVVFLRGLLENYIHSLKLFDEHLCDYFDNRVDLTRYCAAQVQDFLDHTHAHLGAPSCLVLKHPHLTPFFPSMQVLLPAADFIVMVRDPRDVVASAIRAQRKGAKEFGDNPPGVIAQGVRFYYDACLDSPSERFAERARYVRYEDLVRSPETTLEPLGEFLGLDFPGAGGGSNLSEGEIDWSSSEQKDRALHSDLYGAAVSEQRVGRYTETLTDAEVAEVEEVCARVMERFGYQK